MNAKYQKALEMATAAHNGQLDKAGNEFITHPLYIAEQCRSVNEKLVALLYNTLSMTDLSIEEIRANFGSTVSDAILAINKVEGESSDDYIKRVKANPIARAVKVEDIKYNILRIEDKEAIKNLETDLEYLKS